MKQQTLDWKETRKNHIGSSDIAAIMNCSPWKSAYELWLEKTGRKEEPPAYPAMLHGIEREPQARIAYEKETDIPMMPQVFIKDFCMASLDGISFDGKTILEIKCPMGETTFKLAERGLIEPHYECQIQWQLMVSEANEAHFWVFHDLLGTKLIKIKPDEKKQKELLEAATAFWDLVTKDIEPPHVEVQYEFVDSEESAQAVTEYNRLKQEADEINERLEEAKAKILAMTSGGYAMMGNLKITLVSPHASVDWKAARKGLNLKDEQLSPYMKQSEAYQRITILKN